MSIYLDLVPALNHTVYMDNNTATTRGPAEIGEFVTITRSGIRGMVTGVSRPLRNTKRRELRIQREADGSERWYSVRRRDYVIDGEEA